MVFPRHRSCQVVRAALPLGTLCLLAGATARAAWTESTELWRHRDALDFDDLVLTCALIGLAATTVWLAVAVSLTAVSLGRGRAALVADVWARRVTPSAMRGLLGAACGAVALTTASPVVVPASAASPGLHLDGCVRAVATHCVTARPPVPDRPTAADRVVVRAGDTLWSIARRELPVTSTDSTVARTWPRWFAANRARIGPDPDLIRPGTLLRRPPAAHTLLRRPDSPPSRQGSR